MFFKTLKNHMVVISISTTSQKQNYLFFPYCNAATDKIPFLKPTSPAKNRSTPPNRNALPRAFLNKNNYFCNNL